MRTSIATVCISGSLVEKLHACAAAGFDGIEIMDADLVAAYESPEEIRALCDRLGLSIDLFQPFRDFEGVSDELFEDNMRRARDKFELMKRLGSDMILVCSNVATATNPDPEVAVAQLGALADLAAEYDIKIAYEALAWGRYVNDYRVAWDYVKRADRPNLGTCLDSFHILSRKLDPAAIEDIPGEKIYFLQLADAHVLDMDILSWSRHYRLFPGEGDFDLVKFLSHVLRAGYTGPVSLELFSDTFRQTDVGRTAVHAIRSLRALFDRTSAATGLIADDRLPDPQPPTKVDFVEIGGADLGSVEELLAQLGFSYGGHHRHKPLRLWTAGDTRIVLNPQRNDAKARLTGFGLAVADADAAFNRAIGIGEPSVFRPTSAGDQKVRVVAAPDDTEVSWTDQTAGSWLDEFEDPGAEGDLAGAVDHLSISYSWKEFDEAVLFATAVLGLDQARAEEQPGLHGLIKSQEMRTPEGDVRITLDLAPPTADQVDRQIAIRVDDVMESAMRCRERGLPFLPIPDNYYDDLEARFGLEPDFLERLRDLKVIYDRDATGGEFLHFYTPTVGGVYLELVERRGGYNGYGGAGTPVRIIAHQVSKAKRA